MSEPGTQVEKISVAPLVRQYGDEFGKVLPRHVGTERFERWCLTFLKQAVAGKQAQAWARVLGSPQGQLSVMHAFMDCAQLGLEPGRTYHLVPYGEQVTGITDWKGEVELIYRAGRFPVVAQLVRKADEFHMLGANVPPRHVADWFNDADRGPVVGGYAYCQLGKDAYSLVVLMSEADFEHHKAKAKTKDIWDEWPEAMRLKTLVHQLRKWAPWATEIQAPRSGPVEDGGDE